MATILRGKRKQTRHRQLQLLVTARITAVDLIRRGARKVEVWAETSRGRGWVVEIAPGKDVGSWDYVQQRYTDWDKTRPRSTTKPYSRRYWQRKTGTFYR